MPDTTKVIYDTVNDVYLKSYSTALFQCLWGAYSPTETVTYPNQAAADSAIAAWGGNWGSKYIGRNPPPH